MPPNTQNPLVIAAYVVGVLLSMPMLAMVVKAIVFITRATSKLDTVAQGQDELAKEFREYRHDKRQLDQLVDVTLTLLEADMNTLQERADITVRRYPDRRVGPPDRRTA